MMSNELLLPASPVSGRTYIAGPMTGKRNWNKPAFAKMAERLREAGIDTLNPHELHDADKGTPWDWYLRADLVELVKCTRIVLLPGWQESRGATVEHFVAVALGIDVVYPEQVDALLLAVA